MVDRADVIAWLLAARHDSAIEELPEYEEALRLVGADAELAEAVEQEKAYYDQHDDYLAFIRLPDEARARIKGTLRAAAASGSMISFPWRPLAIAASLVAVASIGILALRPDGGAPVVQADPVTFDGFRQFAADTVDGGIALDFPSGDAHEVLAWLRDAGGPSELALEGHFEEVDPIGCMLLKWEGELVSLMCFQANEGVVHLFVTPASVLPSTELAQAVSTGAYSERETLSWADADHAYVLVAHDPGQTLTEFSG